MKYLFIDGWCDFSVITDGYRENAINPIMLLYATSLKNEGSTVEYMDAAHKDFEVNTLFEIVKKEEINCIIFYATLDNIHSLTRLVSNQTALGNIRLYALSVNEDLSSIIGSVPMINIIYDERKEWKRNQELFFEICKITKNKSGNNDYRLNYDFYPSIVNKNAIINIGSGCNAKCTHCIIHESVMVYRDIDCIMADLDSLFAREVNYFHIANHSFTCSREFVEVFCKKLIGKKSKYNFAWSCVIIPEFFIDKTDLLPLMADANLKKVEIACENGSEKIRNDLGLKYSLVDLENIINHIREARIPVIAAHFIIGTQSESLLSLEETRSLIMRILYLCDYLSDIYLHPYFPEKESYSSICDKIIKKRIDFVCNTDTLHIYELKEKVNELYKEIYSAKKENISKVPLKIQYDYFNLARIYGITTQIYKELIEKSSKMSFFTNKTLHDHSFFSWEVEDSLDTYTPYFFTTRYIPDVELNEDYSNLSLALLSYVKKGLTVKEICEVIQRGSNGTIKKDFIVSTLIDWQNQFNLIFVKYLE